jgi:Tfp pilus assembly protein FimV
MVAITLSPPRTARPIRLPAVVYRRRRLLLLGAALVFAALLLAALSTLTASAGFDAAPAATVTFTVEPGDTIWSIAERLAPGEDPRPLVDAIVDANGGADLDVGQRVLVELP